MVAPRENSVIYDDFITFGHPGPTFFAPQTGVRLRLGPGLAFSLFLVPPVRKSDAEGGQRVANVTPNAPKRPPGDLPKSMKNRLCGLRGARALPGGLRVPPRLEKCSNNNLLYHLGDMPRGEKFYVFIVICAAGACENI